ncbi:MAG: SusC/RagA family TonB-linked outer membrane protein [Chloroflexia bacterium]|nr:SusC/RagA family TonB-linked outer membrane protein [Chloroflexia bacterium]
MNRRCLLLLSLLIFVSTNLLAQQTITGKVTDENNDPIVGANVLVKGTNNGTITDMDGVFNITAPEDATLLFSFVGYATQEIAVAGNTNIEVKLLPDDNALEEVVVTALGIERDKKALGYAVQDVKSDELTTTGDANIATALQGKVAGVIINQSGSGIGGTSRIEIRGASSLSDNNQPLIVVDGVPFNSADQGEAGIWGGVESAGGMADINPQDIESISVLKGPNAAALYGSRAGNGVILITTKKGSSKGLNIDYNGNVTVSQLAYYLDLQDDYGQGHEGVYDRFATSSWGPKMGGQMLESWTGETIPYEAQTDRLKDFTRLGVSQNHNISLSAGGEKGTIRVSAAKSIENGVYNDHKVEKSNFDLRGVYDVTDWLNVDAKASYFLTKGQERPEMGYYSYISYFNAMPMNIRTEDLKPGYEISPTGEHIEKLYTTANANYRNPYFLEAQTYNNDERYRGFGYFAANIKFTDEIKLRLKYGLDFSERVQIMVIIMLTM